MNRLQSELHRLYLADESGLLDEQGRVRAMVLELTGPADWDVLSAVWRGVQADLELPAPAIAVSGTDGLQLWFSLEAPVPAAQAQAFLAALCAHYLPGVAPRRLRLMPGTEPASHARLVPAPQGDTGNWSAFVAPDLAPVFADTPWLDIPPNEEGQSALLSSLGRIKVPAFEAASARLRPATPPAAKGAPGPAGGPGLDPERFLLQVMNDPSVALALRIEAAKALLPRR